MAARLHRLLNLSFSVLSADRLESPRQIALSKNKFTLLTLLEYNSSFSGLYLLMLLVKGSLKEQFLSPI